MDQKESTDILNILVGGAFGAVTGGLMSFLVNFLIGWKKRLGLKCNLELETEQKSENACRATVRIYNGYVLPLSHVCAYITVEHSPSDIFSPPEGYQAYIVSGGHKFEEDRLCWSMAGNPAYIDIYAGEKQRLDVVEIDPKGEWIQFPSENGWGTGGGISRAFLKLRKYTAKIKIISKETMAKEFDLQIDPFNKTMPLSRLYRR